MSEPAGATDPRRVVVVGPCASGKSSLVAALAALGYDARVCGQEHSIIRELWRHSAPDVLIALAVDPDGRLHGVVTDGDLRRHMSNNRDLLSMTAEHVMTKKPATIARECLAVDALRIMEERRITSLVVTRDGAIEGVVHLHDLWRTQMI